MKTFKNLKQIKNRDEYIKIAELNYANTFLDVIGQNEEIERILPTEIINLNLQNKFTDIRGLTKSGKIVIIEGHTDILREPDFTRYYTYFKDTYCDYSKDIKFIIVCLSEGNNLKRSTTEENICFKPLVVEVKKIDGSIYLKRLRDKFKEQVELDHNDCGLLVHLPLFKLPITEADYVREICGHIKECDCIPEEEKNIIIPAMYLNIQHYIEKEFEQEKLLEAINVLKYCENGLDRLIRLAREDEAKKVTDQVTKDVTNQVTKEVTKKVTKDVTNQVTKEVTKKVTDQVTEEFACNLLRADNDVDYVHEMTGLPISKINELKANL